MYLNHIIICLKKAEHHRKLLSFNNFSSLFLIAILLAIFFITPLLIFLHVLFISDVTLQHALLCAIDYDLKVMVIIKERK